MGNYRTLIQDLPDLDDIYQDDYGQNNYPSQVRKHHNGFEQVSRTSYDSDEEDEDHYSYHADHHYDHSHDDHHKYDRPPQTGGPYSSRPPQTGGPSNYNPPPQAPPKPSPKPSPKPPQTPISSAPFPLADRSYENFTTFDPYRSSTPAPDELSCAIINHHVKDCPICCKFYQRDTTLYIVVIVVLLLFNFYLLRKLLN